MNRLHVFAKQLDKLDKYVEDFIGVLAKYILEELIQKIDSQDFNFPKLSSKYLREKIEEGASSDIFVRTGKYRDSLRIEKIGRFSRKIGAADVSADTFEGTYNDLAKLLEFGDPDNNLPARPLYQQLHNEIMTNSVVQRLFQQYVYSNYAI